MFTSLLCTFTHTIPSDQNSLLIISVPYLNFSLHFKVQLKHQLCNKAWRPAQPEDAHPSLDLLQHVIPSEYTSLLLPHQRMLWAQDWKPFEGRHYFFPSLCIAPPIICLLPLLTSIRPQYIIVKLKRSNFCKLLSIMLPHGHLSLNVSNY